MLTALLYTILIMSIRSKARNLFPISLMTISTISALFIIEVRSETLPMIPSRKLFFVVSSILAMIFLSALIAVTNLSFLTNVTLSSVLLVDQRGKIACCTYFLYRSRCQASSYRLYHFKTSRRLFH